MKYIENKNQNKNESAWTIESVFQWSIIIKIAVFIFIVLSFLIIPQVKEVQSFKGSRFLSGYYQYDGSQFKEICAFGYLDNSLPYPENIQNFAFMPGEALVNCSGRLFRSVLFLEEWGPVIANAILFIFLGLVLKLFLDIEYKDSKLKYYLWFGFMLFPMSMFLHLNYSEIGFLIGTFLLFYFLEKQKWMGIALTGLFIGFFRITAIPLFMLGWLRFTYLYVTKRITQTFLEYIKRSFAFTTVLIGPLVTFSYYYLNYGDFFLYFKSQEVVFGRTDYTYSLSRFIEDLKGAQTYWDTIDWSSYIAQTGFTFYTSDFRYYAYTLVPFILFCVGCLYLVYKRRWFWLLLSISLLTIPLLSSTNSLNRYLLQSFPIVFALFEMTYKNVYIRWAVLGISTILFGLFISLHMRGFWVG